MILDAEPRSDAGPRQRFFGLLGDALREGRLVRLTLARPRDRAADLLRVLARPIVVKDRRHLSVVWRYRTSDVTKNLLDDEALALIDSLIVEAFRSARLETADHVVELGSSKRDKALIRVGARGPAIVEDANDLARGTINGGSAASICDGKPLTHNRERQRLVAIDRPFLAMLGVTDDEGRLIPAMARKWRQINKFIEIFVSAWRASNLSRANEPLRLGNADGSDRPLEVVDFGAGKGYLTFALYDYLVNRLGLQVEMTGVELRADLVAQGNRIAEALGLTGLHFRRGDIDRFTRAERPQARLEAQPQAQPQVQRPLQSQPRFDVMIALHACDTATDDALFQGMRAGAAILICSPCCHQELRPQLLSPSPLRPILRHGIHLEQQAEMLTDSLRALLLEAGGYDARVFEFVALEHTRKNKMILATRRDRPDNGSTGNAPMIVTDSPDWSRVDELKAFYGIRVQRLDALLRSPQSPAFNRGNRPDSSDASRPQRA